MSLALVAGLSACGGASFQNGVYRDAEASYRVGTLGGGWHALAVGAHNDLAYEHRSSRSIVQVNATCDPGSDVPLVALTNHLLVGFTERDVRQQELVPLDRREALRTEVIARLDGVARHILFYVMKKDDCVYDLTLIAPSDAAFETSVVDFESFARDFHAISGTEG